MGALFVYGAFGCQFTVVSRYVAEDLGGSRAMSGLAVSMFFAAAVVARPLTGRFIDRVGRRWFLVVPPFLLVVLMLGFHLAHSVSIVLALRFVQGALGAGFYIAAVAAATDLSPPERRASAIAQLSIAMYIGFAVGPWAGEWLLDLGPGVAWTSLACLCALGGFVVAGLGETRDPMTLPPLSVPIFHPLALLPGVAMLGLGVGYSSITALSTLNARRIGLHDSTSLYVTFAVSVLLVRLGSGRLADRRGPVPVVYAGIVVFGLGFATIAAFDRVGPVLVGIALVGAGWALVLPAQTAWVASRVGAGERGAVIGSLVAMMDIGQGTGGYVVGRIADVAGFGWAYALPAVLAVVALGVTTRVPPPEPGASIATRHA